VLLRALLGVMSLSYAALVFCCFRAQTLLLPQRAPPVRNCLSHHKYILFFLHMYVRCAPSLRLGGSNQPRLHTHTCAASSFYSERRRAIWLLFIFRRECFEWAAVRVDVCSQHHQNNLLSGRARRWIKVAHGLGSKSCSGHAK
jgi:hypothetical protein